MPPDEQLVVLMWRRRSMSVVEAPTLATTWPIEPSLCISWGLASNEISADLRIAFPTSTVEGCALLHAKVRWYVNDLQVAWLMRTAALPAVGCRVQWCYW